MPAASDIDVDLLTKRLRAAVRGEVRFGVGDRALYATDASNYRHLPIGVVLPLDADDVVATISACRDAGAPIVSRGGGTGLAGGACNVAVLLDFSKYMNRVVSIDWDAKTARVQPGVVLDDLRNAAEERHLTFGPDPATHSRNTLGGMIGNNSCGMHAQMAGKVEENIEELDVITYDGVRLRVGRTPDDQLEQTIAGGGRTGDIYAKLKSLRDRYADLIRTRFPKIPRRVSGYPLDELLPENGFHVARALVGTESTCVTVLEATCRLVHSPPERVLAVFGFEDIATAADHVAFCNAHGPIALEAIEASMFEYMARKGMSVESRSLFPAGDAWLIVEFGADSRPEARAKADGLAAAFGSGRGTPTAKIFDGKHDQAQLWEVRESGLGSTSKIPGEADFYPGWEDSAVAPERMGAYLRELMPLMRDFGYKASMYGHFGQGCLHCSINFDLFTADGINRYREFAISAAKLCVKYGGSLSGEHGDGQARGELLPIMYGEELVRAFGEFKAIWDPAGKMNPGKIIKPRRLDEDLRWGTSYEPSQPKTYFAFQNDQGSFAFAANRCVGTGVCRKHGSGTMCPSYMATKEEKHSTRGRARLLFEMLRGDPLRAGWHDPSLKEALDLCLACKGCKSECPVNVDMATYKAEFLAHYYRGRPRPIAGYAFGHMDRWAALASIAPDVANFVTQAPVLGRVVKSFAGIADHRRLPTVAARTFRQAFAPRRTRNDGTRPAVILWTDTWTNHFDPSIAHAAVEVLESAGFDVSITPRQICCGRPLYDWGMLGAARAQLRKILAMVRGRLRDGTSIVGLEPSCISVFRDEMRDLLGPDEDVSRFAAQSYLLSEFLAKFAPDFRPRLPRKALVHQHCHHKAVLDRSAERTVLDRIGVDYAIPDTGCCGMAGAFGFERSHYEVSVRIGERALLPAVRSAAPDTLVVADGFSCREQIAQLTNRRAIHPAQLLKMAVDGNTDTRGR